MTWRTTGYFNEYGEVRSQSAKNSTTAMRAMGTGASTGTIFDVLANRNGTEVLAVTADDVRARQQSVVTSAGGGLVRLWSGTQAAYDALPLKDPGTLHIIVDA
jgi:hypothetical protein